MRARGCDISLWQDSNLTPQGVNFSKMRELANFVFIKATEADFVDEDFSRNWRDAKQAGLLRGAYAFLRWEHSGKAQAEQLIGTLNGDWGELPVVADVESVTKLDRAMSVLREFCETIKTRLGKTPILYTGNWWWTPYGSKDDYWKQYSLWIAAWPYLYDDSMQPGLPKPWSTWLFWQYSAHGAGSLYGVESGNIDLDVFNGDERVLYQYAGLKPPISDAEKLARLWEAHPELHA